MDMPPPPAPAGGGGGGGGGAMLPPPALPKGGKGGGESRIQAAPAPSLTKSSSGTEMDMASLGLPMEWAEPQGPAAELCLAVQKDGMTMAVIGLERAVTLMGRNSKMAHEVLEHESISRRHMALIHGKGEDGGLWVVDLGSANGTFVDGEKLPKKEPRRLEVGDELSVGESSRAYLVCSGSSSSSISSSSRKGKIAGKAVGAPPLLSSSSSSTSAAAAAAAAAVPPNRGAEGIASVKAGQGARGGGKADKKRQKEEADASRKAREAEIAAITSSMMSTAPTYTKFNPKTNKEPAGDDDDDDDNDDGIERSSGGGARRREKGDEYRQGRKDEEQEEEEEEEAEQEEEEDVPLTAEDRANMEIKRLGIPVSHEVVLGGHDKSVTALSADPGGGRVATGGKDYKVQIFDFGGMDRNHRAFRTVEAQDGHVVVSLSFSSGGGRFLACTASATPKIFSRDGVQEMVFVRGDPYLKDMTKTKGHVTVVTSGEWHPDPSSKHIVMTSSIDGTVRLWDINGPTTFDTLINKQVLKLRSKRNLKTGCVCASFNPTGDRIAAGDDEGGIHLLQPRQSHKQAQVVRDAHSCSGGGDITAMAFHTDGHLLASRAMDDTVKLWDLRKFAKPVKVLGGISTTHATANMAFSPNDSRTLVVGTNVHPKSEDPAMLNFYDVYGPDVTPTLQIGGATGGSSIIRVLWHPKINQIVTSTSAGQCKVFYDPNMSTKGALLSSTRKKKRQSVVQDQASGGGVGVIHNPHALPMFATEHQTQKRKAENDRKDPKRSKLPDPPVPGRGLQGRVSTSNNFTQYVMKNKLVGQANFKEEDPRAALLAYAEKTEKDPLYFGKAYGITHKDTKLASKTLEEEEKDFEDEQRKLLDT